MDQELTYESALKQLEQIAADMESGQMPIDKMAETLKQARKLIDFCQKKLLAVDEEVKKIL